MSKFVVMVEGKNCAIRFRAKKWSVGSIFGGKMSPEKAGFFATRFAVAETASDAEKIVVDAIRHEIETQWGIENVDSDPPIFLVSETRNVDSLDDPGLTAKGFTFYVHDERH